MFVVNNDNSVVLQVKKLTTRFITEHGFATVVDNVEFQLKRGETFALLGESGCGKSITALSLMQLLPINASNHAASEIIFDGINLLDLPEISYRKIRGQRISMIFQEPMTSLNPVLTIGEQIGEILQCHFGLHGKKKYKRIIQLLKDVRIPEPKRRLREYPHQLSGGMKQRIMIAMALAGEPDILIADEPTTALDVTIQAQILVLLKEIQQKTGMAILFITHDLGVVYEMADTVAVMYAGQIIEQASREAFFADPQHPYSKKLFAALPQKANNNEKLETISGVVPALHQVFNHCRFADRCEFAWPTCRQQEPGWFSVNNQQDVRCHLFDTNIPHNVSTQCHAANKAREIAAVVTDHDLQTDIVLTVNNLKVEFPITKGLFKKRVGSVKAVDGVELQLHRGKTLALVGESGCGKTTIGRSILQLIEPSQGTIKLFDHELTKLSAAALRKTRSDLQIIFQDPYSSMNPRMTIKDILAEGMISLKTYHTAKEREFKIDELLTQVGLSIDSKYRYPHEFSGGQRQRICIARALAVNPKVIICDEPTSALDVSVQAQILNLLKDLQHHLNLSYLFITHNIAVVKYMADEIAVMYLGRIVEFGNVKDVLATPKHPYTSTLLSAIPQITEGTAARFATEPENNRIFTNETELPSPINPPSGCHFHPRCSHAMGKCKERYPAFYNTNGQQVKCFLFE